MFQTSANRSGEPAPDRFGDVDPEILTGSTWRSTAASSAGEPSTVVGRLTRAARGLGGLAPWRRLLREGARRPRRQMRSLSGAVNLRAVPPATLMTLDVYSASKVIRHAATPPYPAIRPALVAASAQRLASAASRLDGGEDVDPDRLAIAEPPRGHDLLFGLDCRRAPASHAASSERPHPSPVLDQLLRVEADLVHRIVERLEVAAHPSGPRYVSGSAARLAGVVISKSRMNERQQRVHAALAECREALADQLDVLVELTR